MPADELQASGSMLDPEGWRATFSSQCYQCDVQSDRPGAFSGWVQFSNVFGLLVTDCGFHSGRTDRTRRHVRADSVDHYAAVITLAGRSTLVQNDQAIALNAGDIGLLDKSQPATFTVSDSRPVKWLAVQLPRRTLIAHLGSEPLPGARAQRGSLATRALIQLAMDAVQADETSEQSRHYMQLTVYDMLGAMFAGTAPGPLYAHTQKLFERVCDIIRTSFTDPDLGPSAVAAEAKISLRYLQMLFTARGLTCTRFILSLRLEHAWRLILRRNVTRSEQPLSGIAYLCGFRDYNYFAKAFHRKFGRSPGELGGDPS